MLKNLMWRLFCVFDALVRPPAVPFKWTVRDEIARRIRPYAKRIYRWSLERHARQRIVDGVDERDARALASFEVSPIIRDAAREPWTALNGAGAGSEATFDFKTFIPAKGPSDPADIARGLYDRGFGISYIVKVLAMTEAEVSAAVHSRRMQPRSSSFMALKQ